MNKKVSIARGDSVVVHALLKKPESDVVVRGAPLIVFAHGFPKIAGKTHTLFEQSGDMLQASGFANIIFDYAGSGDENDDDIRFDDIKQDFDAIFQWARNNHYSRVAFITEGLGAAFVYKLMPAQTAFNILFWPALDIDHALQRYEELEEEGLDEFTLGPHLKAAFKAFNLQEKLLQKRSPPTLILHGDTDDIFPSEVHLDYARKHLMARRLEITEFEQGKHGLTESAHQNACMQHIVHFIKTNQKESEADKAARLERAMKILEN